MLRSLMALFAALSMQGCWVTRHGDATLNYRYIPIKGQWMLTLKLPEFDLAENKTHRFSVRNLPKPILPKHVQVPAERWGPSAWLGTNVAVQLTNVEGVVVFDDAVTLTNADCGLVGRDLIAQVDIDYGRFDRHCESWKNYDVVISIITPSPTPEHRAQLIGVWYIN